MTALGTKPVPSIADRVLDDQAMEIIDRIADCERRLVPATLRAVGVPLATGRGRGPETTARILASTGYIERIERSSGYYAVYTLTDAGWQVSSLDMPIWRERK